MILDMGDPVRVTDIINRLIEISGKECQIEITGIREGEKIHEVLVSSEEQGEVSQIADRTVRAKVPPVSPNNLDFKEWLTVTGLGGADQCDDDDVEAAIRSLTEEGTQIQVGTSA